MPKMPWLKLHTEIRTDPKMQALSDLEFRTWINILCLSAESKVRGVICIEEGLAYPIVGLARTLFITVNELTSCLNKFQELRMIDVNPDGIITVTHFDDRQYDKPSDKPEEVAKRVRKHRMDKGNAKVTPIKREKNAIEEDKEVDKERNINDDDDNAYAREEIKNRALETNQEEPKNPVLALGVKAVEDDLQHLSDVPSLLIASDSNTEEPKNPICALGSRAIAYAECNFGRFLSPTETHGISEFCMEFATRASPDPDAVVIEALKRCIENDQRKMSYLRGILVDWLDHGVNDLSHISKRDKEWAAQKIKAITKSKRGDGNAKNLRDTKPRINDSSTYNPAAWAAAGYSVST